MGARGDVRCRIPAVAARDCGCRLYLNTGLAPQGDPRTPKLRCGYGKKRLSCGRFKGIDAQPASLARLCMWSGDDAVKRNIGQGRQELPGPGALQAQGQWVIKLVPGGLVGLAGVPFVDLLAPLAGLHVLAAVEGDQHVVQDEAGIFGYASVYVRIGVAGMSVSRDPRYQKETKRFLLTHRVDNYHEP